MRKKQELFIFGAGASYGARMPSPPLGNQLHAYVQAFLRAKWSELGYIEDSNGSMTCKNRQELDHLLTHTTSFEVLATKLITQERLPLLQKLNALMACALTPPINDNPRVNNAFVEQPDHYDHFLLKKYPHGSDLKNACFITLNYDCLLERAICRRHQQQRLAGENQCLCRHVNYRLNTSSLGIDVLKPHGSINWVADISLGDGTLDRTGPIPIVGTIRQDNLMEWTRIEAKDSPEGHEDIVVAHYAREKSAQANRDLLNEIRALAFLQVERAGSVTLIGIHIPANPSDDPFLQNLFTLLSRKVRGGLLVNFINPDLSELKEAASLGFQTVNKRFQEYVAELPAGTAQSQ